MTQSPVNIIAHYLQVARGLLNFYRCADNRWQLVKLINWHLRYSLLHTLAHKYSSTLNQIIKKFSITPSVWAEVTKGIGDVELKRIISYITTEEIYSIKRNL